MRYYINNLYLNAMLKRPQCLLLLILSTNVFAVDKVVVLGLLQNKAVVNIDGKQRLLKAGKPSSEGVLLVSANSKEAIIEIDGKQNTYILGQGINSNFAKPAAGKSITITSDRSGAYTVNGSINGFQVNFLVDTGASFVSMNGNDARRMGIEYRLEGKEGLSSTASGVDKVYFVNLETVAVGDIKIHNVGGSVRSGNFPKIILLGNAFLNKVKMIREGNFLKLEEKPY